MEYTENTEGTEHQMTFQKDLNEQRKIDESNCRRVTHDIEPTNQHGWDVDFHSVAMMSVCCSCGIAWMKIIMEIPDIIRWPQI
jgi:hypothetical protein